MVAPPPRGGVLRWACPSVRGERHSLLALCQPWSPGQDLEQLDDDQRGGESGEDLGGEDLERWRRVAGVASATARGRWAGSTE